MFRVPTPATIVAAPSAFLIDYFNEVFGTEIDSPVVEVARAA